MDKELYNRAVHFEWGFQNLTSNQNWSEVQRRCKHLITVRLEIETIMEWFLEVRKEDILQLIEPVQMTTRPRTRLNPSFWFWDDDIKANGSEAFLLTEQAACKKELDHIMTQAMVTFANTKSDHFIIDVRKQMAKILETLFEACTLKTYWDGIITGGPMIPEQEFLIFPKGDMADMVMLGEFIIVAAKKRNLTWLKEIKIPAMSMSSNLHIHYGANSLKYKF